MVLAAVDVADRQRAGRLHAILRHRACGRAGDRGRVVASGDGDVDLLRRRAVRRLHGQRVVHNLAGGERLNVGGCIIEGVAPHSRVGIERECAVGRGQRQRGLEVILAGIDVGNRQRAGRR